MPKSNRYPTCFFCYAWDDEERFQKLSFLRYILMQKANKKIEIILDRYNYEYNQNIDELRNKIWSYDLVVLFCTPDLLEIVNDLAANSNKKREVSKEYKIVKERFRSDPSTVFPVILEGGRDTALPDIFRSKIVNEFDKFGIYPKIGAKREKGKYIVPNEKRRDFNVFVGTIINTVEINYIKKSEDYSTSREGMDKLFRLTDTIDIPDSCLVKPDIYTSIRNQSCYLVVGRKGAGKSTFINNFFRMDWGYCHAHYKRIVPISAEAFEHDFCYTSIALNNKRDLSVISLYERLCLFWQLFFYLHTVVTVGVGIEKFDIKPNHPYYDVFNIYKEKLKSVIGLKKSQHIDSDITPSLVFKAAVEMVSDQFTIALQQVAEEYESFNQSVNTVNVNDRLFLTAIAAKFTIQNIIENRFGEDDTSDFIEAIRHCKKRIMISFDTFDTHSEDFRITTDTLLESNYEEYNRRTEYERLFFRTLIEVVTKFKEHKYRDDITDCLGRYIDFCIVLPKDRYDQIIKNDRDSFKKRFGSMTWTAYELMELLTKRMELLIEKNNQNYTRPNTDDYFLRMKEALDYFPGLPKTITMNVDGNKISMSLFNYILRSSFWRPRDVISNLSCLLSLVFRVDESQESVAMSSLKVSEEGVKLMIKDNAKKIINEEFIKEYIHVFRNLDAVLDSFQGFDEMTELYQFKDSLQGIHFDTSFSYDMEQPDNKLLVLYQLGVIGLRIDKKVKESKHYLHHICFIFNEGMTPFEEIIQSKAKVSGDVYVIFNPIFSRRLMINFNNSELIGDWSKEYIENNHKMKARIEPF